MSISFTLRDAAPQDKPCVWDMMQQLYGGAAALHSLPEAFFDATFTAAVQGNPFLRLLVLDAEGTPCAGYVLLSFTWSNEAGGMEVLVEELFMQEAMRGKGLGKAVFAWLRAAYPAARRFRLEVAPTNPAARRLYEREGFTELGYTQMVQDVEA